MKKLLPLLLCLLLIGAAALAEIEWPADLSPGQQRLASFVAQVNEALAASGGGTVDVLHGLYPRLASLGMDGLEQPEDPFAEYDPPAEISISLTDEGLHTLTLRMQSPDRFTLVASACIYAASSGGVTLEDARHITDAYAATIKAAPNRSFEEAVNELQGDQPRAYFAYYPNQFHDQHNWIQMTLIFPLPGSSSSQLVVPVSTPAPPDTEDGVWLSQDNFTHLEVFASPTPEPDSAAME